MARQPLDDPLVEADDFVDPGQMPAAWDDMSSGSERLVLNLDDLLPAPDGSVIFDADVPVSIELSAGHAVIESGVARSDAEADGQSVAGYHYVALDDGLTLFYPPETSLVLVDG